MKMDFSESVNQKGSDAHRPDCQWVLLLVSESCADSARRSGLPAL